MLQFPAELGESQIPEVVEQRRGDVRVGFDVMEKTALDIEILEAAILRC